MLAQPTAALVDLPLDVFLSRVDPRAGLLFCLVGGADGRLAEMRDRLGVIDR
jgi:hypothetical protein